jgi:hypothetical protein
MHKEAKSTNGCPFIYLSDRTTGGNDMWETENISINEDAVKTAIIAVKLSINQRLYNLGSLTEEMYTRAKDIILKGEVHTT